MKEFKSILEFSDYFTEERCKEHLAMVRWNGNVSCVHCGNDKVYTTSHGYKCAAKECRKKFTVTVGTYYHGSKISLRKWYIANFLFLSHKKGISSYQLARDINVTQKTAWFMLMRIREHVRAKQFKAMQGITEIDETYIGGKTSNKHKHVREQLNKAGTGAVNKSGVLGILERGGEVRTFGIDKNDGATIQPIIRENLGWGAFVVTDGHGAYKDLDKFYYHSIVNHHKDVWTDGKFHTNSLEGFWSQLKRGINGIYHQVSPKHLHRYCDEFAFRHNTRKLRNDSRIHQAMINIEGKNLTYKALVTSLVS